MEYQVKAFANFLVLFAVVGLAFIFGPLIEAESRYTFRQLTGKTKYEIKTPVNASFNLIIPKIEVNSKIIPAVNAADYNEYIKALRLGVAQAKGTGTPGGKKNIFLFGHSSVFPWEVGRLNPSFYLLSKLEKNDDVYIYYQGKKYSYKVFEKKIVSPSDVKEINNPGNDGYLILQTCWPAGTTLRRLLVYAK